jgi:hypothetical protein
MLANSLLNGAVGAVPNSAQVNEQQRSEGHIIAEPYMPRVAYRHSRKILLDDTSLILLKSCKRCKDLARIFRF